MSSRVPANLQRDFMKPWPWFPFDCFPFLRRMPGGGIGGFSRNRGAKSGARLIHQLQSSLPNRSMPRNPCAPAASGQHTGCGRCWLGNRCPMLAQLQKTSQGSQGPKLAQTTSSRPLCFPSQELSPNIIQPRLQNQTLTSLIPIEMSVSRA